MSTALVVIQATVQCPLAAHQGYLSSVVECTDEAVVHLLTKGRGLGVCRARPPDEAHRGHYQRCPPQHHEAFTGGW